MRNFSFWTSAIAGGLVMFLALLAAVFIGGHTFGQRCSAMGFTGEAHAQCVQDLAR